MCGLGHLLEVAVAGQVPGVVAQLQESAPHVVKLVDDRLVSLGDVVHEQIHIGVVAPGIVAVLGAEQLGQQRSRRGEQHLGIHVAPDDTRQVGEALGHLRRGGVGVVKSDFARDNRLLHLFGLSRFLFRDILQVVEKVEIVGRLVVAVGYTLQPYLFALLDNAINLFIFDFVQLGRTPHPVVIQFAGFDEGLGVYEAPRYIYTKRNFSCHNLFFFS